MDRQFHLLESFPALGSDGVTYKVCVFEHLRRDESLAHDSGAWLPTGMSELRLDSGDAIDPLADGTMRIVRSGVTLTRTR